MGNCLGPKKGDISSDSLPETISPDDRISSLPDDILFLILSLLTSKERTNTRLLSRRWLNLWAHAPVLDFHSTLSDVKHLTYQESQPFVISVNRVLRRHKGQHLKEFKIVCDLDRINQYDIDNWLVFALERKVQSLELNFLVFGCSPGDLCDNYVFSNQVLNFTSRKAGSNGSRIQQFDLMCLKSLSLKGVDFPDSAIDFFLSNCPFLELLEVVGNSKLVNVVISGPNLSLKYMKINYCSELEVISVSNFNLVSLAIPTVRDLTLADLPMLVDLSIVTTPLYRPNLSLKGTFSQASSCHSQLEFLMIEDYQLEYIIQLSSFDHMTKLKRLALHVGAYNDDSLIMLVPLINSCPHLEEFELMLFWFIPERMHKKTIYGRRGCSVKNQTLKVFEFNGYYGRVSDNELVLYLVENAVSLEKIIIDPRDVLRVEDSEKSPNRRHEKEARRIAVDQFYSFKRHNTIPPHVDVLIR